LENDTVRDYKKEYREYHSSTKQKKLRALRNKANRTMSPGPGKEVDHKVPLSKGGSNGKSNWRVVSRKTNREKYDKTANYRASLARRIRLLKKLKKLQADEYALYNNLAQEETSKLSSDLSWGDVVTGSLGAGTGYAAGSMVSPNASVPLSIAGMVGALKAKGHLTDSEQHKNILRDNAASIIGAMAGSIYGSTYADEPTVFNTLAGTAIGSGIGLGIDSFRKKGLKFLLDNKSAILASKAGATLGSFAGLPGIALGGELGTHLGSKIDEKINKKEASMGPLTAFMKLSEKGVAEKTDPSKWESAKRQAKAKMGGKHSARAMQLATQIYKKNGGGYSGKNPSAKTNKLKKWTKQKWRWSGEREKESSLLGLSAENLPYGILGGAAMGYIANRGGLTPLQQRAVINTGIYGASGIVEGIKSDDGFHLTDLYPGLFSDIATAPIALLSDNPRYLSTPGMANILIGGVAGAYGLQKAREARTARMKLLKSENTLKKEAGRGVYLPSRSIAQLKSNAKGKEKLRRASRIKSEATRDGDQYAKTDIHKGKKRGEVKTSKLRASLLAAQDATGKYTSSGARGAAEEVVSNTATGKALTAAGSAVSRNAQNLSSGIANSGARASKALVDKSDGALAAGKRLSNAVARSNIGGNSAVAAKARNAISRSARGAGSVASKALSTGSAAVNKLAPRAANIASKALPIAAKSMKSLGGSAFLPVDIYNRGAAAADNFVPAPVKKETPSERLGNSMVDAATFATGLGTGVLGTALAVPAMARVHARAIQLAGEQGAKRAKSRVDLLREGKVEEERRLAEQDPRYHELFF
jgi:hypothetical protein